MNEVNKQGEKRRACARRVRDSKAAAMCEFGRLAQGEHREAGSQKFSVRKIIRDRIPLSPHELKNMNIPASLKIIAKTLFSLIILVIGYYAFTVIQAREATPGIIEAAVETYGTELSASDLSDKQLDALLAVEDPNFYNHNGIDLKTNGAGITTITQGMVKLLYFDRFKPGIAKLRQSLIARFALDALVSKEEQLDLFVNMVYLGTIDDEAVHGFTHASEVYFDKQFDEFTDDEYLTLVAMIIGPNGYNPVISEKSQEQLETRVSRIKQVLAGTCEPVDNGDVLYKKCSDE